MPAWKDVEFWKIFLKILFIVIIALPWLQDLFSKEARQMKKDMMGADGKWNWREIWEHHSLRCAKGSYFALMFMLVMTSLGQEFSVWLWLLFAGGVAGSTSYAAYLINIKEKYVK